MVEAAQIDLAEEQASELKAKAAAQGLTLEGWLQKLAAMDIPPGQSRPCKGGYSLSELMEQCNLNVALSGEDHAWLDARGPPRSLVCSNGGVVGQLGFRVAPDGQEWPAERPAVGRLKPAPPSECGRRYGGLTGTAGCRPRRRRNCAALRSRRQR